MTSLASARKRADFAEYLAMERAASTKHELWRGQVFAMAGASLSHNRIVSNLVLALSHALGDRSCDVLPSDMKVWVPSREAFVYPDIVVACGTLEIYDAAQDVLLNPTVVVEVLSESTERFDRGEKFAGYRSLPSLRGVVFVDQYTPRIESYTRDTHDEWVLTEASSGSLEIAALELSLAVADVYRRVEFSAAGR